MGRTSYWRKGRWCHWCHWCASMWWGGVIHSQLRLFLPPQGESFCSGGLLVDTSGVFSTPCCSPGTPSRSRSSGRHPPRVPCSGFYGEPCSSPIDFCARITASTVFFYRILYATRHYGDQLDAHAIEFQAAIVKQRYAGLSTCG
jgi:hypothetical protein